MMIRPLHYAIDDGEGARCSCCGCLRSWECGGLFCACRIAAVEYENLRIAHILGVTLDPRVEYRLTEDTPV